MPQGFSSLINCRLKNCVHYLNPITPKKKEILYYRHEVRELYRVDKVSDYTVLLHHIKDGLPNLILSLSKRRLNEIFCK